MDHPVMFLMTVFDCLYVLLFLFLIVSSLPSSHSAIDLFSKFWIIVRIAYLTFTSSNKEYLCEAVNEQGSSCLVDDSLRSSVCVYYSSLFLTISSLPSSHSIFDFVSKFWRDGFLI
jgi:hypothetical protein